MDPPSFQHSRIQGRPLEPVTVALRYQVTNFQPGTFIVSGKTNPHSNAGEGESADSPVTGGGSLESEYLAVNNHVVVWQRDANFIAVMKIDSELIGTPGFAVTACDGAWSRGVLEGAFHEPSTLQFPRVVYESH